MTSYADLFAALAAPFHQSQVEERVQGGRKLFWIKAPTAMNRFDEVLGPENWEDSYHECLKGLACSITITLPDGRRITKTDGGAGADMTDTDNDVKSAFSDAFKRAAVKFGVGRYLYECGVPDFVGERNAIRDEQPTAPRPQTPHSRTNERNFEPRNRSSERDKPSGPPKTGRALFAWTKDMEAEHGEGLLKYLNSWAKLQDLPKRMVDFTPEQVELAYHEAVRKLDSLQPA